MTVLTPWSQLTSVNAPAPTGLISVFVAAALRAVGEALKGHSEATSKAKAESAAGSLIVRVVESTTVIPLFHVAIHFWVGAAVAGSAARSQLYLTAAASQGVPSVNLTASPRSLSVQLIASVVVRLWAMPPTTLPLESM